MSSSSNDPIPFKDAGRDDATPPPAPDVLQGVHKEPDDHEEVYFEGPASLRGQTGAFVLFGLVSLLLIVGSFAAAIHWGGRAWYLVLACLFASFCMIVYPIVTTRMQRFKITNYRVDYERGLFSTTIDTIELWHVEDVVMHQSFWDKMLKVGTIVVKSHDATLPTLYMTGLPDPRKLFELMKQRIISVKRSRGVIKMDPG